MLDSNLIAQKFLYACIPTKTKIAVQKAMVNGETTNLLKTHNHETLSSYRFPFILFYFFG